MDSLERELEKLVDAHGLKMVVDRLASVCWEKSEHIQHNWQDKVLALKWKRAASRIDNAGSHMEAL